MEQTELAHFISPHLIEIKLHRTSTKAHLFDQSLFSGCVQHKLIKAGVSCRVERPQGLCGLLDPENTQDKFLMKASFQ